MKTNGADRILSAMVAVTLATCATYASAQTSGGTPAQSQPIAASSQQNRSDSQVVRDVRRAFTRTTGLNSSAIHVNASHGVVTLTGSVPQHSQVERAGNAARSVRGVRAVSNRLTVRTRRDTGQ